jgi:hypothetical protein
VLGGSERLGRREILQILLNRTLTKSEPFQGILSSGLWYPESVVCSEETVAVSGWAVPPYGSPLDFYIAHNGVPLDLAEIIDRPDVAQRFKLVGKHRRFGFRAVSTHVHGDALGRHEFSFGNVRTGKPFNPNHTFYSLPITTPLPDEARRKRVHGSEELSRYLLIGATAFTNLDRIATEYFGKNFAEADAILDWGCGCGRVFQYLTFEQRSHLTGIDIDESNIEWCKQNFPEARFETVQLQPPTVLLSESFDFVFGISVLTHLTEERQFDWLAELHRVTSTGAALLLSVNGETMWAAGGLSIDRYTEWRSHGFLVVSKNNDLDGSGADGSEYYNTFISRRYIFENWSRYFKVIDVLAGAVCNQQDLVVLQRL